jgi:NAD(P)-dependent dehydrogenase (short-subunit alcohol dehydrogenase family)
VVAEIKAFGGHAVANTDNVATWAGAKALIDQAIEEFGTLNVVVNNAGILRDSFIAGMSEQQWDDVISVHLKGHFCVLRHAAEYWKDQSKAGADVNAAILNTSSGSGTTLPNAGQVNYGAAKAGIAAMTQVAAIELGRYGVRANAITPLARTRLTLATPGIDQLMAKPETEDALDSFDPAAISPLVAYLCSPSCTITGKIYEVSGTSISELTGWTYGRKAETDKPWTIAEVEQRFADWS